MGTSLAPLEEAIPQMSEQSCCGVVEEATFQAREKRANRPQPQPWLAQKIVVVLTLGIIGYAGYVYMGRFCKSIIKQDQQSSSGRATGSELFYFASAFIPLRKFC
jgi:palmitoyltransferase